MPRTSSKIPCRFCHRDMDTRGHRVHELTCPKRPTESDEANGHEKQIDLQRLNGNLTVLLDWYRSGLKDGIRIGHEMVDQEEGQQAA